MSEYDLAPLFQALDQALAAGDPQVAAKSQEAAHVVTLKAIYAALLRGRYQDAVGLLDDEIELEIVAPPGHPFGGAWSGRTAVLTALARNFTEVEYVAPVIEHVVAQGDTVIVINREEGKLRSEPGPYLATWVQLFQFRQGFIVRGRQFFILRSS